MRVGTFVAWLPGAETRCWQHCSVLSATAEGLTGATGFGQQLTLSSFVLPALISFFFLF